MGMICTVKEMMNLRKLFTYVDDAGDFKPVIRGYGKRIPYIFEFKKVDVTFTRPRLFLPKKVTTQEFIIFRTVIAEDSVHSWKWFFNGQYMTGYIDFDGAPKDVQELEEFQQAKKVYKLMVNKMYGEALS